MSNTEPNTKDKLNTLVNQGGDAIEQCSLLVFGSLHIFDPDDKTDILKTRA